MAKSTQRSVEVVISATDEYSKTMDQFNDKVQETAESTKVGAESAGAFASALGFSGLGGSLQQIGTLNDRVRDLSRNFGKTAEGAKMVKLAIAGIAVAGVGMALKGAYDLFQFSKNQNFIDNQSDIDSKIREINLKIGTTKDLIADLNKSEGDGLSSSLRIALFGEESEEKRLNNSIERFQNNVQLLEKGLKEATKLRDQWTTNDYQDWRTNVYEPILYGPSIGVGASAGYGMGAGYATMGASKARSAWEFSKAGGLAMMPIMAGQGTTSAMNSPDADVFDLVDNMLESLNRTGSKEFHRERIAQSRIHEEGTFGKDGLFGPRGYGLRLDEVMNIPGLDKETFMKQVYQNFYDAGMKAENKLDDQFQESRLDFLRGTGPLRKTLDEVLEDMKNRLDLETAEVLKLKEQLDGIEKARISKVFEGIVGDIDNFYKAIGGKKKDVSHRFAPLIGGIAGAFSDPAQIQKDIEASKAAAKAQNEKIAKANNSKRDNSIVAAGFWQMQSSFQPRVMELKRQIDSLQDQKETQALGTQKDMTGLSYGGGVVSMQEQMAVEAAEREKKIVELNAERNRLLDALSRANTTMSGSISEMLQNFISMNSE